MYQFLMKNKLGLLALFIFIMAVGQLFVGGDGDRELYTSTQPPADLAQSNRQAAMEEIGIDPSTADGELGSDESAMGFMSDEELIDSAEGFDPTPEEEADLVDDETDTNVDDTSVPAE